MTGPVPRAGGLADPVVAAYDENTLTAVLPGAAAALGVDLELPAIDLPTARRVCVVLIDGLGEQQLRSAADGAPFLSGLSRRVLLAGCPSTTATSMASLGTGQPPGTHGLGGYSVLDPDRGVLLNELTWHPDTDPLTWQPHATVFERLADRGIASMAIGNPEFAGSGLTLAAHRGAAFVGERGLHRRVRRAAAALADPDGPSLVYLYWGEVDAAGHRRGWRSAQWRRALRHADRQLSRLADVLPSGTVLVVTADHGMVDAAAVDRMDLAAHPDLADGVQLVGGEPRLAQLYCRPGAAPDVADRLTAALGDRAWVRARAAAEDAGWFGRMDPAVRPRFGDVLVAARGLFTLVHSEQMTAMERGLIGYHGSLTAEEQQIPLAVLAR